MPFDPVNLDDLSVPEVQAEAQKRAARTLDTYWDDDLFPVDPYTIARSMGIKVLLADMPDDVSGLYTCNESGQTIYVERSDGPERRRFTAGHELGHAASNPDGNFVDYKRDALSTTGINNDEIFANTFSASLLMPRYAVEKLSRLNWSTVRMANFFGVSNSSMQFRLKNLGLI